MQMPLCTSLYLYYDTKTKKGVWKLSLILILIETDASLHELQRGAAVERDLTH
jgi:hypothetical protein